MTSYLSGFAFVLKFKQAGRFRFDFEVPLTRSANVDAFCNMFKKHVLLSTTQNANVFESFLKIEIDSDTQYVFLVFFNLTTRPMNNNHNLTKLRQLQLFHAAKRLYALSL